MTSQSGDSSRILTHLTVDSDTSLPWPLAFPREREKSIAGGRLRSRRDASTHSCQPCDQHLVDAARSGCRLAFGELWNLYSRRIYSTVLKILKNPQDAEDASQDAFLRAVQAIEGFEDRARFYTWLTRIAINSALGILRNRRRKPETSLDSTSQWEGGWRAEDLKYLAPGPEQILDVQQRQASLKQAMNRLPVKLREAIYTQTTEDCGVAEVARRLDISYTAAKSRLYRAQVLMSSSVGGNYAPRSRAGALPCLERFPQIADRRFNEPGKEEAYARYA